MRLQPVLAYQTLANTIALNVWDHKWSLQCSNRLYYCVVWPWSTCFDGLQNWEKFWDQMVSKFFNWFLRGISTEAAQLWSLFPPHLQFWAQKDALHDVSPSMPRTPHTKWTYLFCGYNPKANTIGYVYPVGIARNHCLWWEIILTIRCIKSSSYTQFTSTLAMFGMIQRRLDIHFNKYVSIIHLGHLGPLEMIISSLFYWLCALL